MEVALTLIVLAFVGLAGMFVYFLPTLIGFMAGREHILPIAVLNVFLGWTFVFWIIALVWACIPDRTPYVQVIERRC